MNIAFRVDAGKQIGTGHFMRCLVLAKKLSERGDSIRFLARALPPHLIDTLYKEGFDYVSLDTNVVKEPIDNLPHSQWLETSQFHDAQLAISALSDKSWDLIVVDHYGIDVRWESLVHKVTKKLMVIDDLADRKHCCDILIDQNFYVDLNSRYQNIVPSNCQLLLGPKYALLRNEFRELHERAHIRSGSIKKILVFLGGDASNLTTKVIEQLLKINLPSRIDVVVGEDHPYREEVRQICAKNGYICHVETLRMAELMLSADLAIGAGGSATWERCCVGLPGILLAFAENQIKIVRDLTEYGACVSLSEDELRSESLFQEKINKMFRRDSALSQISSKAYHLVDGCGVDRVLKLLN